MCKKLTKESVNERIADRGIAMVGEYVHSQTKAIFQCAEGHQWDALPHSVMGGKGCPRCFKLTPEIVNARIADRGLVMIGELVNVSTKATFRCVEGHQWDAKPSSVMDKSGCPHCADHGFNPGKPAVLYYIRFDAECGTHYKIGITNRDAATRFKGEKTPFTILQEIQYDNGQEALDAEKEILNQFSAYRYKGPNVLTGPGSTELFVEDVLGLAA